MTTETKTETTGSATASPQEERGTDNGTKAPATGKAHALLSASSAFRWMQCMPSAVAESKIPDQSSEFAKEGTLAHAIGAKKIKEMRGRPTDDEDLEIEQCKDYYAGEMEDYTDAYRDFVAERLADAEKQTKDARLLVEERLDFSHYVPEGFGTGDAVIVSDGLIEIIDLKYGKGVRVMADRNPQMMLYALGALDQFDYGYRTERVRMTIFQPRLAHFSSWECTVEELTSWADTLLWPTARLAFIGAGVRNAGEWCRFCRAKGGCTAIARKSLELHAAFAGDELTAEELSQVLQEVDTVTDWTAAVKQKALDMAVAGGQIPGFKLVEGRSVRAWSDQEAAMNALAMEGIDESSLYETKARTLAQIEKTVGKKEMNRIAGKWITKPAGKPTLVPESDKRPALNDFAGIKLD